MACLVNAEIPLCCALSMGKYFFNCSASALNYVFWLSLVMALLNLSETVSSGLAGMLACFCLGSYWSWHSGNDFFFFFNFYWKHLASPLVNITVWILNKPIKWHLFLCVQFTWHLWLCYPGQKHFTNFSSFMGRAFVQTQIIGISLLPFPTHQNIALSSFPPPFMTDFNACQCHPYA